MVGFTVFLLTAGIAGTAPDAAAAPPEHPLAIAAESKALKWGGCPPIFPGECAIAVLHGDPSRPNADVFLKVAAGYEIPPHSHSSAERMILVSGQLKVRYQGAAEVTLVPGNYAYGPAGMPHRASCISKIPCTLFIAFEGPVDALPTSADIR